MPLDRYGVLKARILARRRATASDAHYHVLCGVGTTRWRVAINARSDVPPSEIAQALISGFEHPLLAGLEALHDGWHHLDRGLDYIRGELCRPEQFTPLPLSEPGPDNDLNELFDRHLPRDAHVYAFGEPWGPDRPSTPTSASGPAAGSTTSTPTRATCTSSGAMTVSGRTAA